MDEAQLIPPMMPMVLTGRFFAVVSAGGFCASAPFFGRFCAWDAGNPLIIVTIVVLAAGLVIGICFMERAQRRVLIQYPKRQTARGAMAQERSHLPIKINISGVIPPIFASSLLLMPLTVIQMSGAQNNPNASEWLITISTYLQHGSPLYLLLYGAGIAFFCFFYAAVQFNSEETAENLKRHGGFIPGFRPRKAT